MDTRTLCLAVLQRGEASGYEIKKALDEPPFSHFQDTSFGSIYPALTRLAGEGAVEVRALEQEKRPAKKIYSITEQGRRLLCAALTRRPAEDRFRSDFLFLLFHGDLMAPERVLDLIDASITRLEEQLARLGECRGQADKPMQRFVHQLGVDYYGNAVRFLRDNRGRLERELLAQRPEAAD